MIQGPDASRAEGTCHCGAVRLRVPFDGAWRKVRRCDCSFCRRRFVAVASVKVEDLEIVEGADALTLYRFGTRAAEHHFCSHCGIYTHHRRRSDPSEYGINLGLFEETDIRATLDAPVMDGQSHPSDR